MNIDGADTGLSPPVIALSSGILLATMTQRRGPTTPGRQLYNPGLGYSPVARHYWGNH